MRKKNLLLKLQKKYKRGGYVLITEDKDEVLAFGHDVEKLYQVIKKKNLDDSRGTVMYVPNPGVKCVFQISLSIRPFKRS